MGNAFFPIFIHKITMYTKHASFRCNFTNRHQMAAKVLESSMGTYPVIAKVWGFKLSKNQALSFSLEVTPIYTPVLVPSSSEGCKPASKMASTAFSWKIRAIASKECDCLSWTPKTYKIIILIVLKSISKTDEVHFSNKQSDIVARPF